MALDNRQLQALQLLSDGMKYKEAAKLIGIAEQTLKHWACGDPTAGPAAVEFSEELKKVRKNQEQETTENLKNVQLLLSRRLQSWSKHLPTRTSQQTLENVVDVIKAIQPNFASKIDVTQIYNVNLQTEEDIFNEFRRLKSIASDGAAAPDGRRVQTSGSGKPDQVSRSAKKRIIAPKTVKGSNGIHPKSEAGELPPQ